MVRPIKRRKRAINAKIVAGCRRGATSRQRPLHPILAHRASGALDGNCHKVTGGVVLITLAFGMANGDIRRNNAEQRVIIDDETMRDIRKTGNRYAISRQNRPLGCIRKR